MPVIEVEGLTRTFGPLRAVDSVRFSVEEKECFGLLGPNGAGKTTLIRMLTTLLRPTSGTARVAAHDIVLTPHLVRRAIGVVSQAQTIDLDLTAQESLEIYGKYYGLAAADRRARIQALLERVGLADRAHDLVATYSGGMRRRLEIARGLLHRPAILFLDEPTLGLDPQSRRVVWELIREVQAEDGVTVFLTTHYMEEADRLSHRIAIIDGGRVIVLDTPEGLKRGIPGHDIIELQVAEEVPGLTERLSALPAVHKVFADTGVLRVSVDAGAKTLPRLMAECEAAGAAVISATVTPQTLEDVFIHHTGRSIREEGPVKFSRLIGAGVPQRWQR